MMRKQQGFTLIEMLAATVIAVMVLVCILGVTTSLARTRTLMNQFDTQLDWLDSTFELIQRDLQHARRMQSAKNELAIAGYGGIDPTTHELIHRPVLIRYFVHEQRLIRQQSMLDLMTNRNTTSETVCFDVSELKIEAATVNSRSLGLQTTVNPKQPESQKSDEDMKWIDPLDLLEALKPMPDAVRIELQWDENDSFVRTIILR